MGTLGRRNHFIRGLWAGLTAPTALFDPPAEYPRFDATNSLRRSFAKVGAYVNYAVSRHSEQFGKPESLRK